MRRFLIGMTLATCFFLEAQTESTAAVQRGIPAGGEHKGIAVNARPQLKLVSDSYAEYCAYCNLAYKTRFPTIYGIQKVVLLTTTANNKKKALDELTSSCIILKDEENKNLSKYKVDYGLTAEYINLFDYEPGNEENFFANTELIQFRFKKADLQSNLNCEAVKSSKFNAYIEYKHKTHKTEKEIRQQQDEAHGYKPDLRTTTPTSIDQ